MTSRGICQSVGMSSRKGEHFPFWAKKVRTKIKPGLDVSVTHLQVVQVQIAGRQLPFEHLLSDSKRSDGKEPERVEHCSERRLQPVHLRTDRIMEKLTE